MQNYLLRLAWLKFPKILVKIFTKNQQGSSISHKKKKEKRMEREFCLNHRGYHIRIENNLSTDEIQILLQALCKFRAHRTVVFGGSHLVFPGAVSEQCGV